ncbi:MAG TPA: alpha-amylase, partial [Candidatus Desulfofervidus auxilii]|nr:alpha-amylase [Candidatus Desulfofervidus auxilii]
MSNSIWAPEVQEIMEKAKAKYLFPSPADWRDHWIYFIMIDRFNNPDSPPKYHPWDGKHGVFQGGNFKGILAKLDYLKELGVGAIWLSPVFKNCQYNLYTYHGYGFQDFLKVDPRFGTEEDLQTLIQAAHAKGIYVIFDIVLNHAGDVFEYEGYSTTPPWRDEPYTIYWRDETGQGR